MKASIRLCGRFDINPTVSVRRIPFPSLRFKRLVRGSNVAKSLFSTKASAFVSALRRLDFPAFVYPIRAHSGTGSAPRFFR